MRFEFFQRRRELTILFVLFVPGVSSCEQNNPDPAAVVTDTPIEEVPPASPPSDYDQPFTQDRSSSETPSPEELPVSGPDDDPTRMRVAGIQAPKPATWTWQSPANSMRTLQYAVPGRNGSSAAELVVTAFPILPGGKRDGGSVEDNINRWISQFRIPQGEPAEAKIQTTQIDSMKVTTVELAGAYQSMGAPGPRKGYAQLAAIVVGPAGNIFIRLTGPEKTVKANREKFQRLVDGIQKVSG